jgi:large subunit ribosomal protein L22
MLPPGLVGHVRLRYLGTSAQKARLVVNMIRGRQVEEALATLRYTPKAISRDILRALDSAVANARNKRPEVDVDRLRVSTAFVDGGPSLKRIRPAPMGRAFRVQKRMCHVTLGLEEIGGRGAAAQAPGRSAAAAHEAKGSESKATGSAAAPRRARTARPSARPDKRAPKAGGGVKGQGKMKGSGSKKGGGG